ncbi:MAG: DEAD/DEAH box helicase, partial [Methanobacteriaceae archaeon]|nr:DEAD/DEAH box helicase [Methanobacteriaceae archaeon]
NQIQNIKLENNKITAEIEKNIIEETPLIATTILSSTNTIINEIDYTYLIIDEASQVPIYLALIPLLKTEKFILVGDDKQLQPITNKQATHLLNQSIFHHMKHKYLENHTFLETQYRMNKEISQIASKLYYQKRLKTNDKNKNIQINIKLNNILLNKQPITYINTANTKNYEENINSGCINKKEAQLIKDIIETLLKQNIKPEQIGIISPYKKQQKQIQKIIQNSKIETDTIYRFQGREKDIIIISFCKSNLEQLKPGQKRFISQTNQLNVSITRAKKKLIIIGDYNILQQTKNTKELIKSINPKNIIHLEIFN